MADDTKLDLGTIHIHKKVLADIAISSVAEISGVRLVDQDIQSSIFGIFGQKSYPGVHVTVDRGSDVSMEIKVLVNYGLNIPALARQIQDAVKRAVEKTVDIKLKDVNVNIQGIVRGEK